MPDLFCFMMAVGPVETAQDVRDKLLQAKRENERKVAAELKLGTEIPAGTPSNPHGAGTAQGVTGGRFKAGCDRFGFQTLTVAATEHIKSLDI